MYQHEFVLNFNIRCTTLPHVYNTTIESKLYGGENKSHFVMGCTLHIKWRSECPSRALPTLPEREALWVVSAAIADFRRKISCGQLLSIDAVLDALAEKGDISDASAEKSQLPETQLAAPLASVLS